MEATMPAVNWVRIRSEEDLPKKPGLESYEYVECLIFHDGEVKHQPWNCEHRCWDDEDHDDFYCEALAPTHYAIVSYADVSALKQSGALPHIPQPEAD
jgi:hypothetical protein|nr:hypothetical protein [Neorhizobium tomejilense]